MPSRIKDRTKDRRPSRAERRSQLLDAAVDAIRDLGPNASMEQLAAAGGVTKPILYRHFVDRDGLVMAVGEVFADRLLASVGGGLHSDSDDRELLRATVGAYLEFLESEPELYSFLMSNAPRTTDGSQRLGGLVDAVARQVAVVIGDRLRAQGLDAGGAEPWAFGIVGMVHQAGDWWLGARTMSRDALLDYLTTLLWDGFRGLGPDGSTAPAP